MNQVSKIETSLASAMAAAFAEIEAATKSATNPHFKSKYADLGAVIEAVKPPLIKHGLFFTQRPSPSENGITIETVIGHAGGEELSLGSLFVPANKQDAQAFGSALTYARRYALVTAFGVPVEDDDGHAAARGQSKSEPEPSSMPDAEWAKLVHLIEATSADTTAMLKHYGVTNLRHLNQDQYGNALAALNAKLAKLAKEETNAKARQQTSASASEFAEVLEDEIPY